MTELQAAVAAEQVKRLNALNTRRLQLVDYLRSALAPVECLMPLRGREQCDATWYLLPMRFDRAIAQTSRGRFVDCLHAEGVPVGEGYVRPLYLLPLYQRRLAFKHGYPWSARENRDSDPDYSYGSCPTAERLYSEEIVVSEHVRPPHTEEDMDDIAFAVSKVATAFATGQVAAPRNIELAGPVMSVRGDGCDGW